MRRNVVKRCKNVADMALRGLYDCEYAMGYFTGSINMTYGRTMKKLMKIRQDFVTSYLNLNY